MQPLVGCGGVRELFCATCVVRDVCSVNTSVLFMVPLRPQLHACKIGMQCSCCLLYVGTEADVAAADAQFNGLYQHLIRQALDISICLEGSAAVEGPKQDMVVRLMGGSDESWPLSLTNDFDLLSLFAEPASPAGQQPAAQKKS